MKIRGAPAIAILSGLSIAVELEELTETGSIDDLVTFVKERLNHLITSRPTAVNLANLKSEVEEFLVKHKNLDYHSLKLK